MQANTLKAALTSPCALKGEDRVIDHNTQVFAHCMAPIVPIHSFGLGDLTPSDREQELFEQSEAVTGIFDVASLYSATTIKGKIA